MKNKKKKRREALPLKNQLVCRAAGCVCLVSSVGHKSAGHVQWLKNIAKANSAAPETQYTLVPHIPLIHRFNEYLSDYSGCKCDGSPSQQNQAGLNRVRVRLGPPGPWTAKGIFMDWFYARDMRVFWMVCNSMTRQNPWFFKLCRWWLDNRDVN